MDILGKPRRPYSRKANYFPKILAEDTAIFAGLPKDVIKNLKKSKEFAQVLLENLDTNNKKK